MDRTKKTPGSRTLSVRKLSAPLTETRQAGDRYREIFFVNLAWCSCQQRWTPAEVKIHVQRAVIEAILCGALSKRKSIDGLIEQGCLVADPANRKHIQRLLNLREAVLHLDRNMCLSILKREAHMLIDILRRHRNPEERHHVASPTAYLKYLGTRLDNKILTPTTDDKSQKSKN